MITAKASTKKELHIITNEFKEQNISFDIFNLKATFEEEAFDNMLNFLNKYQDLNIELY